MKITIYTTEDDYECESWEEVFQHSKTIFHLDCSHNNLSELPPEIGYLENLLVLVCSFNNLKTLPSSLENLQGLWRIDCSFNSMETFPHALTTLKVDTLNISHNLLKEIPDSIKNMARLQEFDCSCNRLHALPTSLVNIERLNNIKWSSNYLDDFLESLGNPQNTRELLQRLETI